MHFAEDYHAAVLALDPQNRTVLIIKDHYEMPLWKFPGGGGDPGETPFETAAREHEEETGVAITLDSLIYVTKIEVKADGKNKRNDHTKYFFVARVDSFEGLKRYGDEGERTGVFNLNDIDTMVDIHPLYYSFYLEAKKAGLIP